MIAPACRASRRLHWAAWRATPFQPVVQQTLAALEDRRSSTRDIARILSKDESIAAAVLRRANSVLYRARGKADTISQAVTWLGFEHVRSLLIGVALLQQGRLRDPVAESNRKLIWQHSSVCARWAVELAVATRYSTLEEASLAGLLHDVGKIVIGASTPRRVRCIARTGQS